MRQRYDVVVIGGGAAGLSGALTLARARRSVLVIDSAEPRNAPAGHVHNYLAREGTPPADLLAIGRTEVTGYGGEVVNGTVVAAERVTEPDQAGGETSGATDEADRASAVGEFRVRLADGRGVRARRLLVATGLVDELPDVPGLAERWGRDVLHCPYCHGWEVRDQPIAVLSTGPTAVHQALLFRQWSPDVTLLRHTGPEPDADEHAQLAARGVRLVTGEVVGLVVTDDRLTGVRLRSGEIVECRAVTVQSRLTVRAEPLAPLGLTPAELLMNGHVAGTYLPTEPSGATAVPGVWVAGNAADPMAQVIVSAARGMTVAAAINADLVAEDTRLAVAAAAPPPRSKRVQSTGARQARRMTMSPE